MDVGDAFRSATALLVGKPGSILPVFLAATGSSLVPQVFVLLGLGVAYQLLRGTGRIEQFADALAEVSAAGSPDGEGIDDATAERLLEATAGLFTTEVIAVVALTLAVVLVVGLLARSLVAAAQVHTVLGALVEEPPIEAAILGASRDWLPFVGYSLLQSLVVLVPTVLLIAVGGWVPAASLAGGSAVGAVVGVLALFVAIAAWLLVVVVGSILLLFVPQAVVVDDVGLFRAIRRNLGFLRAEPVRAVVYVAVAIGVWVAVGFAATVLAVANVGQLATAVAVLAVVPWLALFKTALYVDAARPSVDTGRAWPRFRGAFGRGGRELRWFVRTHPGTLVGCTAVFVAGVVAGYRATAPYSMGLPAPEDPRDVFGLVPVDDFVMIATNNWLAAVSQAYAGLALGVPALSNLATNGLVVGAVAGVGFDLPVAVALVVPHAAVEVPALVVSAAIGVRLGRYVWRCLSGSADATALADEMRRAFYVLLALAPLFVVAAFVEAFVTPWIAAVVG